MGVIYDRRAPLLDPDLECIERIKQGDSGAFNIIMERHYKSVLNIVYRFYGCSREEAEDIAQEVFIRIYRGIRGFEGRSRFFTWLYKVTMNLCFKKRAVKRRDIPLSVEEMAESVDAGARQDNSVEKHLERQELSRMVKEAVMALPEEQRAVVILHRYHDMSYEDIAGTLGISLAAVKSRLHRARLTLKESLKEYVR